MTKNKKKMVLVTYYWRGDTADLERRYDDVLHHVVDVSPAHPLVHLAVPVEDGFRVYDVWTDEEVARRMFENPDFKQKLEEFGLADAEMETLSVHRMGWPISERPMYR